MDFILSWTDNIVELSSVDKGTVIDRIHLQEGDIVSYVFHLGNKPFIIKDCHLYQIAVFAIVYKESSWGKIVMFIVLTRVVNCIIYIVIY